MRMLMVLVMVVVVMAGCELKQALASETEAQFDARMKGLEMEIRENRPDVIWVGVEDLGVMVVR